MAFRVCPKILIKNENNLNKTINLPYIVINLLAVIKVGIIKFLWVQIPKGQIYNLGLYASYLIVLI